MIKHQAMKDLMIARGFGTRWMMWMDLIFSLGSSSVLLNGVPGKQFFCKKGVRQGDPLSPLLFVLAADLRSIFNEAMANQLISTPLQHRSCNDFPIIQYANDTVLIMHACQAQLNQVKNLLMHFTTFTGLRVNYDKSVVVPINTPSDKMQSLALTIGCKIGSFPFTYLGLPLCLSKPKLDDFMPIMQRVERRLMGCSTLLSQGDKLVLLKYVFYSLLIFFMCTLSLPMGVVDQLNKYLRFFFWRKYGNEDRGPALISWSKVCKPKVKVVWGCWTLLLTINDYL